MDIDQTPLIGRFIAAAPTLRDPNFSHSVVLLLDHGADGALGVVVNRPSEVAVATILPEWADHTSEPGVVFSGGPVQTDALIGLARMDARPDTGVQVLPGLGPLDLSGGPAEQAGTVGGVRLFAGYAGWSAGQLEDEISAGGWFVIDGSAEDALTPDPDNLWRQVLVRQGGVFRTVPADPSTN